MEEQKQQPQTQTPSEKKPTTDAPGVPQASRKTAPEMVRKKIPKVAPGMFARLKGMLRRGRTRGDVIPLRRDWAIVVVLGVITFVVIFAWGVELYYTVSSSGFFVRENSGVIAPEIGGINENLLVEIEERITAQDERQEVLLRAPSVVDPSL